MTTKRQFIAAANKLGMDVDYHPSNKAYPYDLTLDARSGQWFDNDRHSDSSLTGTDESWEPDWAELISFLPEIAAQLGPCTEEDCSICHPELEEE